MPIFIWESLLEIQDGLDLLRDERCQSLTCGSVLQCPKLFFVVWVREVCEGGWKIHEYIANWWF